MHVFCGSGPILTVNLNCVPNDPYSLGMLKMLKGIVVVMRNLIKFVAV